jgi:hypothetical protein
MTATSAIPQKSANLASAGNCGRSRRKLRSNVQIVDCARGLFPIKTASQLSEITGYPLRTVEAWLTGAVKIPTDAFVALLHTDYGREFFAAVMTDAEPRWWIKLKAFFNAIDVMAMQRATRRKLKEALDADYADQIPHAALFQDEEFYSSQPAPAHQSRHRAMVGRKAR